MEISVGSQAYVFLYSILGGMLIGFIYDMFRIKRKKIKTRSIVLYAEDLLYWIIASLVMFATVYYSNEGEIRGFIFIGTVLGVVFYTLVFSRLVIKISLTVIDVVVRIIKAVWHVLIYPFRIIFKIVSIPCRLLYRLVNKLGHGAKRAGRRGTTKLAVWGRMLKHRRKKI